MIKSRDLEEIYQEVIRKIKEKSLMRIVVALVFKDMVVQIISMYKN